MAQTPGIVIAGPAGRMGRMLIEATLASDRLRLTGALVRPGHGWDGADLGTALGGAALGVPVGSDPAGMLTGAAALIDFTSGPASAGLAGAAAAAGVVHVVGSSGLSDDEMARLDAAARETVVIFSGNMSLGVNILAQMTRQVAAALDADFDIEIVEAHHRHKVDAPSGTALMLGEAAAEGRGVALREVSDRGRDGHTGPRRRGDIGFSAVRAGDIVGEHDVVFAGAGERLVLRHVATDRGIYARGALKAAEWGIGRAPGRYSMLDVLGL